MKKSKSTVKNEVQTFITKHSVKWNISKDQQLAEIVSNTVNDLMARTNDDRDIALALFVIGNDAQKHLEESTIAFRNAVGDDSINRLGNNVFNLYALVGHTESVIYDLHENLPFEEIYRKNQFYHNINRFIRSEMTIPQGFSLLFGNTLGQQPKYVLVDVDKDVLADDLFTALLYGYFMPEPTEDTHKLLIDQVIKTTNVDLLSKQQTEKEPKEGEVVEKATASEMIEKHLMNGIRKREA